jgi:hypothetical protein
MADFSAGVGVTSEQEEQEEVSMVCSYCGVCGGSGFYQGGCCPACGGGT